MYENSKIVDVLDVKDRIGQQISWLTVDYKKAVSKRMKLVQIVRDERSNDVEKSAKLLVYSCST